MIPIDCKGQLNNTSTSLHVVREPKIFYNKGKVNQCFAQGYCIPQTSRNRTCTGLFVSRLEPHYTAKHIEAFIWQQAGEKVRVEKITGRASLHSSFYVPCDRPVRDALKNSNIWPTGCFVKLYFS